jgi:hypothetical protein
MECLLLEILSNDGEVLHDGARLDQPEAGQSDDDAPTSGGTTPAKEDGSLINKIHKISSTEIDGEHFQEEKKITREPHFSRRVFRCVFARR